MPVHDRRASLHQQIPRGDSAERAEELLACGLDRVILGTVAIEQPDLVKDLAARHPGKVVVGMFVISSGPIVWISAYLVYKMHKDAQAKQEREARERAGS